MASPKSFFGQGNEPRTIQWQTDTLELILLIDDVGVVRLRSLLPIGQQRSKERKKEAFLPLTEVRLAGDGNSKWKGPSSLIDSVGSLRLKYQSHRSFIDRQTHNLKISSFDETRKLLLTVTMTAYSGIPALRSQATITNASDEEIVVTQLSSLTIGGLAGQTQWWDEYVLSKATNFAFRELDWTDHSLPSVGVDDVGLPEFPECGLATSASHNVSNHGSRSSGANLPMGMLKKTDSTDTWLWQIETNGSWRWEIGDFAYDIYISLGGPTRYDHDWAAHLDPGASFTSVPVAVVHVMDSQDHAFQAMNQYRRCIRRPHPDLETLPVIFNDYMNCLNGDPTEDKVRALIEPALYAGAEYFVIDAGWYADDGNWWDDVGLWEPSKVRFPSGFKELLVEIKERGLIPGIWLEPEVVGVRSVVANMLPDEAFFRDHVRIQEKGRYQLDYRHPAVRERMDTIIDNWVNNFGVGYFKFDYNIEIAQGTDVNTRSRGAAALEHNRAYLTWISGLYERHPNLVIETCSGGGARMDYAMLALHQLQSTSDQQNPVLYATIAAAAPTAVCPEQSATWAYPLPRWSDEVNALTVLNSLLGRVHLSGKLDQLSKAQLELVREGMSVYKSIRLDLKTAQPFWPLGLPQWHDTWVCLGMRTEKHRAYVALWRRNAVTDTCKLPITLSKCEKAVSVRVLYPSSFKTELHWDSDETLSVTIPSEVGARLIQISQ